MPLPQRKNIRLAPCNYIGDGYYFVTVCTREHHCLFGTVMDGVMVLNALGSLAAQAIADIPLHYPQTELIAGVVMPNHVHFILHLQNETHHLGRIVGAFKAAVSREAGGAVWQRSFYDHIIQYRPEFDQIIKYISDNPLRWEDDKYFTP